MSLPVLWGRTVGVQVVKLQNLFEICLYHGPPFNQSNYEKADPYQLLYNNA